LGTATTVYKSGFFDSAALSKIALRINIQEKERKTMARTQLSLDGAWDFWPIDDAVTSPAIATGKAPYSLAVPGIWQNHADLRNHQGAGLYRTTFDAPHLGANERLFLHFGAVDWSADVWVNGIKAGVNDNGWLPFEFDITQLVAPGANTLVVRAADPVALFPNLPHGKQSWYGLMSGIWQSVRVEVRPATYIERVQIDATPGDGQGIAQIQVTLSQPLREHQQVSYRLSGPDGAVITESLADSTEATIKVDNPQLWDIGAGNLYTLVVDIVDSTGAAADSVTETFGFRTITTQGGKILLNGKPWYMRGVLDQDYYPDTDGTPPSQEFLEEQFRLGLAMGYNCFRVHIKVADPRYYAAADKVGILIWTEIPNWAEFTDKASKRGEETLWGFFKRDWNHPSILIRTIINESWGIDLTAPEQRQWLAKTVRAARAADPSRLVVGNSACCHNFQVVTDLEDFHMYMVQPDKHGPWRKWVENFATHPAWTYAHEYTTFEEWRKFEQNSRDYQGTVAAEVERAGDEPLLLSEFGNWGLPDVDKLLEGYGGEPWWFEQGSDWGGGEVYPHGVQHRFQNYGLYRAFPSLAALTAASRRSQGEAMKFEVEQIRKNAPIQGYIVTEWSDVNWESNGVVDMRRNPKDVLFAMRAVNQDIVLVPDWNRLSYRAGETVSVPVYLSFYSDAIASGYKLVWSLEGSSASGEIASAAPVAYDVVKAGTVEFALPDVAAATRQRLGIALQDDAGAQIAVTWLDLYVAPAQRAVSAAKIASADLGDALAALGYTVVDQKSADLVVTRTLTDAHREYMLNGGKVVLLAEEDDAVQTIGGRIHLIKRDGSPWQGDWATSALWISQDKVFSNVSESGQIDFTFADLTPRHVMAGLSPIDFINRVHAGIYMGWVHRGAATVLERRVGRGALLASTLRLSPNLATNPLAQTLLDQMVEYVAGLHDIY